MILHGRWARRMALLAAGALDEAESRRARAHAETCAACARELAANQEVLALVAEDPLARAEPPVPLGSLVARVQARIDERARPQAARTPLLAGLGALASVAVAALVVRSALPIRHPAPSSPASPAVVLSPSPVEAEPLVVPADALRRLERTLERDRAARYLSDAQDVLVTVASAPQLCSRRHGAVEVGEERERSRDLLARRQLFVEMDGSATVAARGVLDDVEEMLREVAALDACARPQDLEAIRGEIARRRLLMKIDLVTRELRG
jgi:hypothetical protein